MKEPNLSEDPPIDAPMVDSRPPPKYVHGRRWWNAPWFDTLQFVVLTGALLWLTVTGAMNMGYNWQWYRVPRFIYPRRGRGADLGTVDQGAGRSPWRSPPGASSSPSRSGWSPPLLRLSNSFSGRIVAKVYLEAIRNTPLLIQIYLFYFVLGPIIGLDRFWVGVVCLSVFEARSPAR